MKKLLFPLVMLAILAGACKSSAKLATDSAAEKSAQTISTIGGKWDLIELDSEQIAVGEGGAFLSFNTEDARFNGNAGCNSFSGGFELGEETIKFSMIMATKMFCENIELEDKLLATLSMKEFTSELKGDQLILTNDENQLTLQKAE